MVPSSQLDPCRSSVEEVSNKLKGFVIGDDSDLDKFLKKGEISQASQLAITVLKSASEETECGQTLSKDTKTLVGPLTVTFFFFFNKQWRALCLFVCLFLCLIICLLLTPSTREHRIHVCKNSLLYT